MRLRETKRLKEGSVITCKSCPTYGCDGKPAKVTIKVSDCGCTLYYHERNPRTFLRSRMNCTKLMKYERTIRWAEGVTGYRIKLINP